MIYNRQDVGDRQGSHAPLTAFGLDDQEFDEIVTKLGVEDDVRETLATHTEYFVQCYTDELKWLYERYSVVGGDILFQRGPLPAGESGGTGRIPEEWFGPHPRRPGAKDDRDEEEKPGVQESVKLVVEHHADGYVAYPLGLKGVVIGQGDTLDEAVADVTSAIRFHIETFGREVLESESPILDAVVTEAQVA